MNGLIVVLLFCLFCFRLFAFQRDDIALLIRCLFTPMVDMSDGAWEKAN
jgi:hypothetical protein